MWMLLRRGRGGTKVPLLAGASAINTPAGGGALTFYVYVTPSLAGWDIGSALFLLYISIVYYMCRKEV